MQPIQKFSDYFKGYQTTQEAIREADLQKEYGEVFMSLLKKYGVSSPAELDEEKKKEFFNEIGGLYKKGEGQTAKGEELVDTEKPEPVKEEENEEEEEEDEEGVKIPKKKDEETAAEIEAEIDDMGEPKDSEDKGDEVPKDSEEVEVEVEEEPAAPEAGTEVDKEEDKETDKDIEAEIDAMGEPKDSEDKGDEVPADAEEVEVEVEEEPAAPEAGTEVDKEEDKDTAKEIEADKVEMGKPKKAVMSFDEFVSSKNESTTKGEESELEDEDLDDVDDLG
jgi:hypothetical protein